MHNTLKTFDVKIGEVVAHIPLFFHPVMVAASFIGHPVTLGVAAAILGAYGLRNAQPMLALASVLSVVSMFGNYGLKELFRRARPDTLYAENMVIQSYSFPSGHSFSSAVFLALVAYLAVTRVGGTLGLSLAVICGVLIVLVGISRVYLGAHFPSDVLAGWVLGLLSALVIIKLCRV